MRLKPLPLHHWLLEGPQRASPGTGRDRWPVSAPEELGASISQQAGSGRCVLRTPGALGLTAVTGAQTRRGVSVPAGPPRPVQAAALPRDGGDAWRPADTPGGWGALGWGALRRAPPSPVGRQVLILPPFPFFAFLLFLCLEENGNIQQFRKTESVS